jgi:subtilisin family serine protease
MKAILVCLFFILLFSFKAFPEQRVKIAIIDTGLDIQDPRFKNLICGYRDFTNTGIQDNLGHGTHVAGLIKQYAKNKNYCFIVLKYFNNYTESSNVINNALSKTYESLYEFNPDVVNYSGGGPFLEAESITVKDLSHTQFFVAAGNENQNIDKEPYYPAALKYPNITPVGALAGFLKAPYSNWGNRVVWEQGDNILSTVPYPIDSSGYLYMSGTSQATAIRTGKYIYAHY